MPHPIIYINSWPGAGKRTIAKEIEKHMEGSARVVHNHLHIDLAGAILPRTSPDYLSLRRQLRSALFNSLATCPDTYRHSYIFTDFQTTNESGASVAKEYEKAAKRRGCQFVPIILKCQPAENERRMRSPERLDLVAKGKGMLLDATVLHGFRKRGKIFKFQIAQELELDITEMLPAQAAQVIVKHIQSLGPPSKIVSD